MQRSKKTPMYESKISPNDAKAYEFSDFTSAELTYQSSQAKQSQLIRKIESLYKSQLLNIKELKQEENHMEQFVQKNKGTPYTQNVFIDIANTYRPFEKLIRLNTYQTLGTGQDYQQDIVALTGRSSCQSSSPSTGQYKIRKTNTYYPQQIQNYTGNYLQSYLPKSYNYDSYQQKYLDYKKQCYPTVGYFTNNSDFTSDQLIQLMPNPYKINLEMLKQRVKAKNQKIL